jgi:hypothetical protein
MILTRSWEHSVAEKERANVAGPRVVLKHISVTLYRKEGNNTWEIVIGIFNLALVSITLPNYYANL